MAGASTRRGTRSDTRDAPRSDTAEPIRRQRRTAETRERILRAALTQFAAHSYDGATTRAIAERAGVKQPLLNYHFDSKDALWRAAVAHLFEDLMVRMAERALEAADLEPVARARLLIRDFVHYAAEHPELNRLIVQETTSDTERMRWMVDTFVQPLYAATTAQFAELRAAGAVADIPAASFYYLVVGAASAMFTAAPECERLTGHDPFDPAMVEAHADAVVEVIFGTPKRTSTRSRSQT